VKRQNLLPKSFGSGYTMVTSFERYQQSCRFFSYISFMLYGAKRRFSSKEAENDVLSFNSVDNMKVE